jgi:hypothetical protein
MCRLRLDALPKTFPHSMQIVFKESCFLERLGPMGVCRWTYADRRKCVCASEHGPRVYYSSIHPPGQYRCVPCCCCCCCCGMNTVMSAVIGTVRSGMIPSIHPLFILDYSSIRPPEQYRCVRCCCCCCCCCCYISIHPLFILYLSSIRPLFIFQAIQMRTLLLLLLLLSPCIIYSYSFILLFLYLSYMAIQRRTGMDD